MTEPMQPCKLDGDGFCGTHESYPTICDVMAGDLRAEVRRLHAGCCFGTGERMHPTIAALCEETK